MSRPSIGRRLDALEALNPEPDPLAGMTKAQLMDRVGAVLERMKESVGDHDPGYRKYLERFKEHQRYDEERLRSMTS